MRVQQVQATGSKTGLRRSEWPPRDDWVAKVLNSGACVIRPFVAYMHTQT